MDKPVLNILTNPHKEYLSTNIIKIMLEITTNKDIKRILEYKKHHLILIYFYCNDIQIPKIDEFINKENYNNNIILIKINSDIKEIINYLDITTVPIIRLYKNNELLDEIYCSYKNIDKILNNLGNY